MPQNRRVLDPAALLAGPRGRRLCLELAGLAADAVATESCGTGQDSGGFGSARFYAAYNRDPDRGTSTVLFGPGAEQPVPNPTAQDVAALLEAVPLPMLTESLLLEALSSTVNSARYWQEPDGDDVLAATPAMRRALHRFAQQLADSPLTHWWTSPLEPAAQWNAAFVADPPRPPAPKGNTAETLTQWRLDTLQDEANAVRERPSDPTSNWSGDWWSRPPWALPTSTRMMAGREESELGPAGLGPVGLWLVEDGFGEDEAVLHALQVPDHARIFRIDSPEDWARLCREHSLEVTASKRQDWYRTTGRNGKWLMPDWSMLKEKYDAVHLTMGGYLTTAGREITIDEKYSSVLAGWDPDATYWLCDVPADAPSRQTWRQDPDGLSWAPQGGRARCLTVPERGQWIYNVQGYRVSEVTTVLGHGEELWQRASKDVLTWKVKTRSGFSVDTLGPVVEGQHVNVTASLLGVKVVEPVQVVAVVDTPDRSGFAYRTLPGHPVSGEEAFIVHRDGDAVHLSIRSLTRAAPQQPWHGLFPVLLMVQKLVRWRYFRALR
ncbi:DUF1990 domain-containing protein [Arthrobacter sp. lap29]|uniref:DUF1990 domain-containing protein n=1 Tax=Arthrobacter sp. lap29 TaxID=3056122 RepID=UPI0028F71EA6|nr:DUF1990 domain-containing protein [Arthrobacter sp. lap29]